MALVRFFYYITLNLDQGTCLAFLNLFVAFHTIDHDRLLTYLNDYLSFGNNALKFIKSCLSDRTRFRKVGFHLKRQMRSSSMKCAENPEILHFHASGTLTTQHTISFFLKEDLFMKQMSKT